MSIHNTAPERAFDRGRYRRIVFFFSSVIFNLVWWDIFLGRIFKKQVRRSRPRRFRNMSRRFKELAIEMGGVMIKLGQFLSARVDVLPPEVTEELAGLQDEVPPVPMDEIQSVMAAELGDISEHFSAFDARPLAAASLGQAHRAWLLPRSGRRGARGEAVVVKVQRPDIEQIVDTDMAALMLIARLVMRYRPIRKRADVPALMAEFEQTLREELDYISEADNAEYFGELFADDYSIRIPATYRDHSTRRVLVLEDVSGIKITNIDGLKAAGVDTSEIAHRLLDAYFLQIFSVGFFHADPHPGNIFIIPLSEPSSLPADRPVPFQLAFVDFGMVGHIEELMGDNLRKVLISVTQRDSRGLTEAYNDLGFFLPGSDLERISQAQERILDQMWGMNLLELSQTDPREYQEIGKEFRDILFDFPFQVPVDFIFLGRALGILSGLATSLDPTINPWHLAERYGQQIISSREGWEFGLETTIDLLRVYAGIPSRLNRVLIAAEEGHLKVKTNTDLGLIRRLDRLEKRISRPNWSVFAAAFIITGAILYINGETNAGIILWVVAGLFFLIELIR